LFVTLSAACSLFDVDAMATAENNNNGNKNKEQQQTRSTANHVVSSGRFVGT
jgi:hypothetical protein